MNGVQEESERRSQKSGTVARHEDLRRRLLDAAEQAVAAEGLDALRARALAMAVGCSVGAIYDIFTDLDALVLEVNGRTLEAIDAALQGVGTPQSPAGHLTQLADAYLGYAASNRRRWAALFQHRMPAGRPVSEPYAAKQIAAFRHIEGPLARLRPDLPEEQRALMARTLFSAVHGMVELGLDEKIAAMPLPVLREQIGRVVAAIAKGL